MKTVSVSEFRKNIKKYVEIAGEERLIVNRGEGKAFVVIPIESLEDGGYNPEFVKKILAADVSAKKGNTTRINDVENIWADIL